MEELLRETRKQLQFQKIITALLAVMVAVFVTLTVILGSFTARLAASMEEVTQKIEEIDVDSINDTLGTMQNLLENADDLSESLEKMTARMQEFDEWLSSIFGR